MNHRFLADPHGVHVHLVHLGLDHHGTVIHHLEKRHAGPYVVTLLDQNIAGEQCAISAYKGLMDVTKDKDLVTYNMALTILEQEVEHEEDLQSLREDLDLMVARGSK